MSALRIASTNLDFIPTSPVLNVAGSVKDLQPRIPGTVDVVVVNSRDKIVMTTPPNHKECWMGDQALVNQNCKIKPTQIPEAIELAPHDLKYSDVVNMEDVTLLKKKVVFSDRLDLGKELPPSTAKELVPSSKKGKMVNFLDKFGDQGPVNEVDTWDIPESQVPEKNQVRINEYLEFLE